MRERIYRMLPKRAIRWKSGGFVCWPLIERPTFFVRAVWGNVLDSGLPTRWFERY
jgi:hypothetical protein